MIRRTLCAGVFALVVLLAAPAFAAGGGWRFCGILTVDYHHFGMGPPYDDVDGRIFNADGTTLVKDGSLVQIIIGLDGAEIVDPLEYFDTNGNGTIDLGAERDAAAAWIQAGADPAAISGGTNVLAYGTLGFTGEFATSGGSVEWSAPPDLEPLIANGFPQDKLAWRAWNLTGEDMENQVHGEYWYTTCREYFTHDNQYGGPDTGWWIGMPALQPGDDLDMWVGLWPGIGTEVYTYYALGETTARSQNRMDHLLFTAPEPGTMLLVASALVLLLARRARSRSRAAG
jgi:hypothetical protein